MCGGFVAAYSGEEDPGTLRRAAAHAAYNGGRLVTYLALGAAAGALGHTLDLAGGAVGVSHVAAVATGVLLVLGGITSLRPRKRFLTLGTGPSRGWASRVAPIFQRFRAQPAVLRALLLGLATTLLPCGWLYAFVALAAGTGGALAGAALMSAFWLGSLPILLGLGVSLQGAARRFARTLPRLRPLLLFGAGAFTLLSRLDAPALAATSAEPSRAGAQVHPPGCPYHRAPAAPTAPAPERPR
jgi:sulfite exporter TauE/SafE